MAEHDLELDSAFAHLVTDVSGVSSPRGAGVAVAHVRRRRRRAYAAAVLVIAFVALGTALGRTVLDRRDPGPPGRPLPAAAVLSATAMTTAMDGWMSHWTAADAHTGDVTRVLSTVVRCNDNPAGSAARVRVVTSTFVTPDRVVASFSAQRLARAAAVAMESDEATRLLRCGAEPAINRQYGNGGRVGFYDLVDGRRPGAHVWLARLGGRIGLLAVAGTSYPPAYDTIARTSDLLIAALRDESSFAYPASPE